MPNWSDYPVSTAPDNDDQWLVLVDGAVHRLTGTVVRAYTGTGIVLVWDDVSDYIPADLKAATNPKEFRGPTDPDTVSGVVLNPYDTWIDTAP